MRARYASANAEIHTLTPVASCSDRSTGRQMADDHRAGDDELQHAERRDRRRGALRHARLAAAEHAARETEEVQHDEERQHAMRELYVHRGGEHVRVPPAEGNP